MIRISFTPEEIDFLDYERRHHEHPRVRQKMEVLYFKAMGVSHGEIGRLANVSRATLVRYLREYQEGGRGQLCKLRFRRPESEMMAYRDDLEKSFAQAPPATINEAVARIAKETPLKRSPTAVRRFMKNIGMTRHKVGTIPSKADPDGQEAFMKDKLGPRIQEMGNGQREIFLSMPPISSGHPF